MRKLLVKDLHPGMVTAEDTADSSEKNHPHAKRNRKTGSLCNLLRPYRRRRSCTAADQFF